MLIPEGVSPADLVIGSMYAVLAFWALYTLIVTYHWLRYSNASLVTIPAIALHLLVSVALISYTLSGHGFFLSPFLP
jgi:hypothetical protein